MQILGHARSPHRYTKPDFQPDISTPTPKPFPLTPQHIAEEEEEEEEEKKI